MSSTEEAETVVGKPDNKAARPRSLTKNGGVTGPQNLTLNTHKAGMEGLDTEKINEIIKNASEGSRFYQYKQKCQQRLDVKLSQIKQAAASFTEDQIKKATLQMDQLMKELELGRDLTHTIVHVDMDMFYAAIEMRDDPTLKNKPMAVGGMGMLSTSNYAARKFGVRAAMPGFIGKKLCPDLVLVPPNFTKYKQASKEIQEIFAEYDANFSPMSLDEAYLDITEYMQKNASHYGVETFEGFEDGNLAEAIVAEMRQKITVKTQLTASAGIAPNTRLAKVCSDMNKPNGQFYLPPDRQQILEFVSALPIRKVCGIGNVTEQQLQALDITVCSHLLEKRGLLKLLFSDISYNSFISIALGLGHTTLETWTEKDRKSISTETTFRGTADRKTLFRLTDELCQELADEMEQKDILGKVFTLKLKTTDFQTKTRAQTLPDATRAYDVMFSCAKRLLQHEMDASVQPLSLRLLGVRMSTLMNSSELGPHHQPTLTQMFLQSTQPKTKSCNKASHVEKLVHDVSVSTVDRRSAFEDIQRAGDKTPSCKDVSSASASVLQTNDMIAENMKNTDDSDKHLSVVCCTTQPGETSDNLKIVNYECPVCGNEIKATNLADFNVHIDSCLETDSTSRSPLAKPHEKGKNTIDNRKYLKSSITSRHDIDKGKTIHRIPQIICSDSDVSDSMDEIWDIQNVHEQSFKPSDSCQDLSMNEVSEERCTEVLPDPLDEFLCPVCEQKCFRDIGSLNKHVDECLNSNAISKILHQDASQSRQSSSSKISGFSKASHSSQSQPQISCKRKGNTSKKGKKKMRLGSNTLEKYFRS